MVADINMEFLSDHAGIVRMKKFLLPVVLLPVMTLSAATAADQKPPAGIAAKTRIVCTSEQSIGFRWVKGNWKSTDFVPARYTVEKLAEDPGGSAGCGQLPGRVKVDNKTGLTAVYGCWAVDIEAAGQRSSLRQVCREHWQKAGSAWEVVDVACENVRFRPDGWFHRTSLHGDLADRPEGGEKEPLSITVGHCRTL